jgi:hypothetical protein
MLSGTSLARSSSKLASSPLVQNDHLNLFGLANGKYQFRAKTQQPVFVGNDQTADVPGKNAFQEPLQTLFVVIHPGTKGRR